MTIAFTSAAAPVAAGEFKPAPNLTQSLDLDVQSGNFSEWLLKDLSGLNALRTQVRFARVGTDGKWTPTLAIGLENGRERVAFRISVVEGKVLYTRLESGIIGEEPAREMYVMAPELNEAFSVDLDWSPDGSVVVTLRDKAAQGINGFERHLGKLSSPPTILYAGASTAEVKLDPLQLGSTTP